MLVHISDGYTIIIVCIVTPLWELNRGFLLRVTCSERFSDLHIIIEKLYLIPHLTAIVCLFVTGVCISYACYTEFI